MGLSQANSGSPIVIVGAAKEKLDLLRAIRAAARENPDRLLEFLDSRVVVDRPVSPIDSVERGGEDQDLCSSVQEFAFEDFGSSLHGFLLVKESQMQEIAQRESVRTRSKKG